MKSGCEAGSTERIETGCSVERAMLRPTQFGKVLKEN